MPFKAPMARCPRFDLPADAGPLLTVADARALPVPPEVRRVNRLGLFDGTWSGDYVAIVHESLTTAALELLEHRAAEGHRVVLTTPGAIFDHFSYGFKDADAIKSFLKFAFFRWGEPRVRNVLLVGKRATIAAIRRCCPRRRTLT
jgi:hypothetical protein